MLPRSTSPRRSRVLEHFGGRVIRKSANFPRETEVRGLRRSGGSARSEDDHAIRYVSGYLNGAVDVGERDLLSPTSVLARIVRWFPGDIQMLERLSAMWARCSSAQFM